MKKELKEIIKNNSMNMWRETILEALEHKDGFAMRGKPISRDKYTEGMEKYSGFTLEELGIEDLRVL